MNEKLSEAAARLERAYIAGLDEEFRDDVRTVLDALSAQPDAVRAGGACAERHLAALEDFAKRHGKSDGAEGLLENFARSHYAGGRDDAIAARQPVGAEPSGWEIYNDAGVFIIYVKTERERDALLYRADETLPEWSARPQYTAPPAPTAVPADCGYCCPSCGRDYQSHKSAMQVIATPGRQRRRSRAMIERKAPVGESPVKAGDWVADEAGTRHPQIAKVVEAVWDDISGEWCANLRMYSPSGSRRKFEPFVPMRHWHRIERPDFPLPEDARGYKDWGPSLQYLDHPAAAGGDA